MHVVTKILIVFCAILSLLLAALTMAYASNANAIRRSVGDYQIAASEARTSLNAQTQQFAQEKAARDVELDSLRKAIADSQKTESQLQAERTDLRARLEAATADAAAIRNQIAQLGATTDTQAALIKAYREEVTALRDSLLTSNKREIELTDSINDLQSAREVLEQNARALKEQLEESKLALQSAQQGGTAAAANAPKVPRELPGPLVRARVVETFKSPAGGDMVVIDEGANRGIKENVLMNVTRGGEFVASIVVTAVEPNRAVGKVNTYGKGGVSKDDVVLSRLD